MGPDLLDTLLPLVVGGGQVWLLVLLVMLGRILQLAKPVYCLALLPLLVFIAMVAELGFDTVPDVISGNILYRPGLLFAVFGSAPLALTLVDAHLRRLRRSGVDVAGVFE